MKARTFVILILVLGVICAVGWYLNREPSRGYEIRASELRSIKHDRGALTPKEQAELDELDRRIAAIEADKAK